MCGIAVSLSTRDAAPRLPLEKLHHRGPDSCGEWRAEDGRLWFGHTRLAILDLSPTGAQPMMDVQSGNVIVFNGEIYNHLALRKQIDQIEGRSWKASSSLVPCVETMNRFESPSPGFQAPSPPPKAGERAGRGGSSWQGSSDTETLLAAYRVWNEAMFERIKGMFAFAIYDARQRSLLLARDRLGIKPLYYKVTDGGIQAASEVRALNPLSRARPLPMALASYLRFGASTDDSPLFGEARVLPAGHWMTVSVETGARQVGCYWPSPRPLRSVHVEPVRQVRRLLESAVEEHLLADVPVASFLSGGIDSSVISTLAARRTSGRLQTFSVGFQETPFDETAVALEVARRCGTEHMRIELSEDETIAMVREAVQKMDLPSVDAINTYIISKKVAEQGIKVALSGLGGDELFGGYPSFHDVPKLVWLARCPAALRRGLALMGGYGRRLAELTPGSVSELTDWRRIFWTKAMLGEVGLPSPPLPQVVAPDLPDEFARISWTELTRYMRHLLLRDSDQMSMAVSLELRLPFLDHDLVEFVLGLPKAAKTRRRMVKGLLVEACQDLLPPSVYQRPKMGFALPMDSWMRGVLRDFVATGLREATARCGLQERAVERLNDQFRRKKLHWTRLWPLAVLGHYLSRTCGESDILRQQREAAVCEFSAPSVR